MYINIYSVDITVFVNRLFYEEEGKVSHCCQHWKRERREGVGCSVGPCGREEGEGEFGHLSPPPH